MAAPLPTLTHISLVAAQVRFRSLEHGDTDWDASATDMALAMVASCRPGRDMVRPFGHGLRCHFVCSLTFSSAPSMLGCRLVRVSTGHRYMVHDLRCLIVLTNVLL